MPLLAPVYVCGCLGQSWGRNKSIYYSSDTAALQLESEEEAERLAEEEEKEARRLQRERADEMKEEEEQSMHQLMRLVEKKQEQRSLHGEAEKAQERRSQRKTRLGEFSVNSLIADLDLTSADLDLAAAAGVHVTRIHKPAQDQFTQQEKIKVCICTEFASRLEFAYALISTSVSAFNSAATHFAWLRIVWLVSLAFVLGLA